ncbi:hypothetical protein CDL12_08867 [Handroanthus impetiginosus]|uniref:WEB family protein n=1 Tax=Handroanthus impetiginosus TaxID=429701 RepID=A0A2G9HLQ6_9LAMI|nr:hypothetical protein CDL12_08867 [Handroanthus impetiginosus]
MAETPGSASSAETKKIINPRVEIDTSPPFESVKEAVDRFGGSGPWIPLHLLRLAAAHNDNEDFDVEKIEEQAVQLEKDLIKKEHETLNVLKELETAKRFVEDLAAIQASVESLNKKLRRDKVLLETRTKMQESNFERVLSLDGNHHVSRTNPDVDRKVEVLSEEHNFEAEQCKKMTEASRYEVMKAMSEIERTKNSIKMAEMRLNAAKKMEEAAKAVEAIALAERTGENSSDGITLTFEEYRVLTQKAKQAEELCKTKFIDMNGLNRTNEVNQLEVPIMEKFEETIVENKQSREVEEGHHRTNVVNGNESYATKEKLAPGFRSTTSIGDVLSRKVVLQDDVMMGRHVENHSDRQRVSLSQMLREQSRLILRSSKPTGDEDVLKQYFVKRKKFGFIQVPIPTRQRKKKAQPDNLR